MSTEEKYDLDLFIEPPDGELKCPICLCVMKDPHQLSGCQHMFCKSCIQTHFGPSSTNSCPVDKRTARVTEIVAAPRAIVNIISRLEMKCFYHINGCREIVRVENHYRHTNGCRYKPQALVASSSIPQVLSRLSLEDVPLNVFVKLAAPAKTIVVTICGSDTVRTLKLRIQEKEGIDPNNMVINFKGKPLQDNEQLSSHGVKNSDIFYTTRRFEGGL